VSYDLESDFCLWLYPYLVCVLFIFCLPNAPHGRSLNQLRSTSSTACQKCLDRGFCSWCDYSTITCRPLHLLVKNHTLLLFVPLRTQQLENPKLLAKLRAEGKPSVEVPEEFKKPIGTANKILEAKEKERSKEDKEKGKETPRKKAKRSRSTSDSDSDSESSSSDSNSSSSTGSDSESDSSSNSSRSRSRERNRKRPKRLRSRSSSERSELSRGRKP